MWNNPLSSNFIVVHFHCHPRHSPAHQFLRRTWRAACCFPISDIGAVAETKHLPRCIESRCLGWTCSNTPKEAELHKGSASSVRCYEFQVSEAFTLNAIPNVTVGGTLRITRPTATWAIWVPRRPRLIVLFRQNEDMISNPATKGKRFVVLGKLYN